MNGSFQQEGRWQRTLADAGFAADEVDVVEQGSHEELMASDGHYVELFRLQASSYIE